MYKLSSNIDSSGRKLNSSQFIHVHFIIYIVYFNNKAYFNVMSRQIPVRVQHWGSLPQMLSDIQDAVNDISMNDTHMRCAQIRDLTNDPRDEKNVSGWH